MENIFSTNSFRLYPIDAASAALKELLASVLRLMHLAVNCNDDEAEHVHQLRVTIRRASVALEVFEDFLPRRSTRKLLRMLNTLRKAAGAARDSDVLAARLTRDLAAQSEPRLSRYLDAMRAASRRELIALFEKWDRGERLERLVTKVLCGIRARRSQAERPEESLGDFAQRRLRMARRECFRYENVSSKNPARLHEFRIRAKKLRYSLEVLRPGLDERPFNRAQRSIKKLMRRLGELNDHASAEALLNKWRHETKNRSTAKILKRIANREHDALRESLNSFAKWWSRRRWRRLRRSCKTASAPSLRHDVLPIKAPFSSPQRRRPAK